MSGVMLCVGNSTTVGDDIWGGWTSVNIRKSLQECAVSFSLEATGSASQQAARRFAPGMACAVGLDGQIAASGYLDEVTQTYGRHAHSVQLSARSPAGDLVDCDCTPPWEYAGLTLTEVVARLIAPFCLSVAAEVDVGEPFERFTINPGDTLWTVIERACRLRAVLAITDPIGGNDLVLTQAGCGGTAPVTLQAGANLLTGSARRSWAERYSRYLALGQQENRDQVSADQAAGPSASLTDPEITRLRPKVLMAEGQGNGVTLRDRAAWQLAVARAKSVRLSYSLQGWTAGADGPLWRPGWLVPVVDDVLATTGTWLIAAVVHTLDRTSGSRTTLDLVPPDAFLPAPGGTES